MVTDHVPHLAYYRRDKDGYHFRIHTDDQYWPAVARLNRAAKSGLKYDNTTRTFHLPLKARATVLLATIFPTEWEIIVQTEQDEILFDNNPKRKEQHDRKHK